jgi:hypothetical protein
VQNANKKGEVWFFCHYQEFVLAGFLLDFEKKQF